MIPGFLSHLAVWRDLPVPFTVYWDNGVPDFRVTDHSKVQSCVEDFLCGLCGTKLGSGAWFVGGDKSLEESRLFTDPPMHEHCARFAVETCPFLSGKVSTYNTARPVAAETKTCALMSPERGDRIGMRKALRRAYGFAGPQTIQVKKWSGRTIWLAG